MNFLRDLVLTEVAMGAGALEQTASEYADKVLFGFEAEMIIHPDSPTHVHSDRIHMGPHEVDSLETLSDYFQWGSHERRQFQKLYQRWFEDQIEKTVDKHWNDFVDWDQQDAETEARNTAEEDIRSKPNTYDLGEDDFFKSVGADEIISQLHLDPKHGWHNENRQHFYAQAENQYSEHPIRVNAAKSLEDALKVQIEVFNTYHERTKSKTKWVVEPDTSIIPDEKDKGVGLEIVSPPMEITQGLEKLEDVFMWMRRHVYTNESTGLHLNLSFKSHPKIDWLKLALFMGEEYILQQFNRARGSYTGHHLDYLMRDMLAGTITTDVEEFLATSNAHISRERHHSFNIQEYEKKGYIEFRVVGNTGYEYRFDEIRKALFRFVRALAIAADPNAHRREYLKKVALLIHKSTEGGPGKAVVDPDAPAPVVALGRLLKFDKLAMSWLTQAPKNAQVNKTFAKTQVENSLVRIAKVIQERKLPPTFHERKAMRELIKQYQLPMPDPSDLLMHEIFKYAGLIK